MFYKEMSSEMRQEIQADVETVIKLKKTLEEKGFETVVLQSEKEVKDFINSRIPDEQIVGLGDSITTCTLNIRNLLFAKGSKIFYSWDGSDNYNRSIDTFDSPTRPDDYLSRINAITMDGRILMKDYDRSASESGEFPARVYAFAGINRLCDEFEDRDSLNKYSIIEQKPENCRFTVALLPFLCY